jgi:hypothetical protein
MCFVDATRVSLERKGRERFSRKWTREIEKESLDGHMIDFGALALALELILSSGGAMFRT